MSSKKYYAAKTNDKLTVFDDWSACKTFLADATAPVMKSFDREDDAYELLRGEQTATPCTVKKTAKKAGAGLYKKTYKQQLADMETKHYAVAIGHVPGVYLTHAEMEKQISGFEGPKYKCFGNAEDAEKWIVEQQRLASINKSVASLALTE